MKAKIVFLCFFLLNLTWVWGQPKKRIEYGVSLSAFLGVNEEAYTVSNSFSSSTNNVSSSLNSNLDIDHPNLRFGVFVQTVPKTSKVHLRTGLDLYGFQYDLNTTNFFSNGITFSSTVDNSKWNAKVLTLPIGLQIGSSDFGVYIGTGLGMLFLQDKTPEKDLKKAQVEHLNFINNQQRDLKKTYSVFKIGLNGNWGKTSLDMEYETTGALRKGIPVLNSWYIGGRNMLSLGTKLKF